MPLLIRSSPSLEQKLSALGQAAAFDLSCACGPGTSRTRGVDGRWIYPAALPSGRRVPMLKVLQHGGCERGCGYCAQRLGGRPGQDLSLAPDDLARLYMELHRQGRVFGLFLSSAIRRGPVATMDRILATASILRGRMRYRGYLHLKILPGCKPDQVERAISLATRVSVNMELPTAAHLARVAPTKSFEKQILAPMRQVHAAVQQGRCGRVSQTTQFVVGAAGETDLELTRTVQRLYRDLDLARVYYSAFQPVPHTPLGHLPPTSFVREHRLYQVDFLLRKYGFDMEELCFDEQGQLPLQADPKTLWARAHPERFPMEINTAAVEELVRVPGIGPVSARRIAAQRRGGRIRNPRDLGTSGAAWRKALPFVLLDGRRPQTCGPQMDLFDVAP